MSSQHAPQPAAHPPAAITPFFVCPGLKVVPFEHALFPFGSDCAEPHVCPIRDCCMWYAHHDLGGEGSILDFPPEAILPAKFRTQPFHCDDFRDEHHRRL